ncbi:MAG: GNAT family N-acetyltransferase [Actinomycetota bacterium]|nr:GNAT family N-acetyltransferase [Actinomycetota bacterium]
MDDLRTERTLLRHWRPEDRDPFAELNADPDVMAFFPSTLSREESDALADRIEEHFSLNGYGLWAVEAEGAFAGFVGLSWATFEADFTPALEIGWRLARPFWGRGLATEAARAVLAAGLSVEPSVVSFTAEVNERSWRVMQRLGMRRELEFDHPYPGLPERLRRHVLYRAERQTWIPHSVLD